MLWDHWVMAPGVTKMITGVREGVVPSCLATTGVCACRPWETYEILVFCTKACLLAGGNLELECVQA